MRLMEELLKHLLQFSLLFLLMLVWMALWTGTHNYMSLCIIAILSAHTLFRLISIIIGLLTLCIFTHILPGNFIMHKCTEKVYVFLYTVLSQFVIRHSVNCDSCRTRIIVQRQPSTNNRTGTYYESSIAEDNWPPYPTEDIPITTQVC